MEFFEAFGIKNAATIVIVVLIVQAIKANTKFHSLVYFGLVAGLTAMAQIFIINFNEGWQVIGNEIFKNTLASVGAFHLARKIPGLNKWIYSAPEATNEPEEKTPPAV